MPDGECHKSFWFSSHLGQGPQKTFGKEEAPPLKNMEGSWQLDEVCLSQSKCEAHFFTSSGAVGNKTKVHWCEGGHFAKGDTSHAVTEWLRSVPPGNLRPNANLLLGRKCLFKKKKSKSRRKKNQEFFSSSSHETDLLLKQYCLTSVSIIFFLSQQFWSRLRLYKGLWLVWTYLL